MGGAQKEAGRLGKLGGICGLGDATPQQRQQLARNDYDGSRGNYREGDFVSATGRQMQICRVSACHFLDIDKPQRSGQREP